MRSIFLRSFPNAAGLQRIFGSPSGLESPQETDRLLPSARSPSPDSQDEIARDVESEESINFPAHEQERKASDVISLTIGSRLENCQNEHESQSNEVVDVEDIPEIGSQTPLADGQSDEQAFGTHPELTDGPCRVTTTNDGTKDCLAILIDKGMLDVIKQIAIQRQGVEEQQEALGSAQYDATTMEAAPSQPEALKETIERAIEMARLKDEIEKGIPELFEVRQRILKLQEELVEPELKLNFFQSRLQALLEQTLTNANLLTLPAPKPESVINGAASSTVSGAKSGEQDLDGEGPSKTQSELVCQEALENLARAREVLQDAQETHDNRRQYYAEDLATYQQNVADGVYDFSLSEFDRIQVKIGFNYTRELIEAEEGYDSAKAQVEALGMNASSSSSFYGGFDDASLAGSQLTVLVQTVDSCRIQ